MLLKVGTQILSVTELLRPIKKCSSKLNSKMLKNFVLSSLWWPVSVWACIGEPTYVHFEKVKKSVEVIADNIVVSHTTKVTFKTKMDVKINDKKSNSNGGLALFEVVRNSPGELKGVLEASDGKKTIQIRLTIRPQKRGGCSKAIVTYY